MKEKEGGSEERGERAGSGGKNSFTVSWVQQEALQLKARSNIWGMSHETESANWSCECRDDESELCLVGAS